MKLCDFEKCTGCGACANACPSKCISMLCNEQGFEYPIIDNDRCINCGTCSKVCQKLNPVKRELPKNSYISCTADSAALRLSSSGGIAFELAKCCVEKGGVVFGAIYDDDLCVKHMPVFGEDKLELLRGSKYVQSEIGCSYCEVKGLLSSGKHVLFFGMPCQIAGLKAFLSKCSTENLLTCDLFCGGVPSKNAFKKYIDYLTEKYGKIEKLNFRSKHFGYDYGYLHELHTAAGKRVFLKGSSASYIKCLGKGLVRESCFNCEYADVSRVGDISIGDYSTGNADKKWENGRSAVLINTVKGQTAFDEIKDRVNFAAITADEIGKRQVAALNKTKKKPACYDDFFADLESMDWEGISKKYLLRNDIKGKATDMLPPGIVSVLRRLTKAVYG